MKKTENTKNKSTKKYVKISRSQKRAIGRGIVLMIAALLLATICILTGALNIFLSTRLHGFSLPDTYTFKVGMDSTSTRKLKSPTYKMGTFYDDETIYVNFTRLLDYCGFYESGDRKELRYILPSDGSYFSVQDGSTQVDMNGNVIHMDAPAIVSGGQLYLPLKFIDDYIEGISIEHQVKIEIDEKTGKETEIVQEFIYIIRCNEENEYSLLLQPVSTEPPIDVSAIQ